MIRRAHCPFRVIIVFVIGIAYFQWHHIPAYANSVDSSIFWTMGGRLATSNLDGSSFEVTFSPQGALNFAIDGRTNLAYFNDGRTIFRTNLDGSSKASLFELPGIAFEGDIAIDPVRDQLFFVDGRNNIIYRSNLDGSNPTTIVPARGTPSNTEGMSQLWLDQASAKLYWNYNTSIFGPNPDGTFRTWTNSIYRTNLDGSQQELLFTKTSTSQLRDFEVDIQHGKVYWASMTTLENGGAVRRANLDGSQEEILVSGDLWGVYGMTLDLPHGKMYYTDTWHSGPTDYDGTIRMAQLDGSEARTIVNLGPSSSDRPHRIRLATIIVPEPSCGLLSVLGLLAAQTLCVRSRFRTT